MSQATSIPPPIKLLNSPLRDSACADALGLRSRPTDLALLTWAFTLFNSLRMLSYLPTLWAIRTSGDSSQHSLWSWCSWLGANLTTKSP